MPLSSDSSLARWTTPECPFTVEYVPRVLDDIRLAVVDAFFSLPRGGAEIGGILLGRYENGRVVIIDSKALDCEHAFGPSFTLSEADQARLGEMIETAKNSVNARPVGWYHSHTRSEIFLSDADLELHRRFFPEHWQVALVLKPHTFQPTRAGFFFRGTDGAIHGEAADREFTLDPLPLKPLPAEDAPAAVKKAPGIPPNGDVINVAPAAEPLPDRASAAMESAAAPALRREDIAPPTFATAEPSSPSRAWVGVVALVAGLALGAGGFLTRQHWAPHVTGWLAGPSPLASAQVGLNTIDHNGQLQIKWDGSAPDVSRSTRATLAIADGGGAPQNITLDAAHLRAGSFTYGRQSERVDVTLTLAQSNGWKLLQSTTFVGQPPPPPPAPAKASPAAAAGDEELRKERDELKAENERLKEALARQVENSRRLEKYLDGVRKDLQRKRLENQADGK